MKKMLVCCSVIFLMVVQSAWAHEVKYRAFMNGASENPVVPSNGLGTALVTMDLDLATMHVQASFSGLTGNTTASHIHCCTAISGLPPTNPSTVTNVGVATTMPSFPGFPLGVTLGTMDTTFDMTLASSYNASFITANGGNIDGAYNAFLNGLAAGKAYFNIHSSFRTGGEIRGFLALVPEPSSAMLAMIGLAGMFVRRRRK